MTPFTSTASRFETRLSRPRTWLLLLGAGAAISIFGCLAGGNAIVTRAAVPHAYGGLMGLTGCFALLPAIVAAEPPCGKFWLLSAILYLLASVCTFANPAFDIRELTLLLAGLLAASGLARIAAAISWRGYGFGWPALSGLASLAFAAMLANSWPEPVLRLLGLVLAVDILLQGVMLMLLAYSVRKVTTS
ncbi:HdeD family acid-resistance protein [Sphingobium olei]|uniref:HdeD family acid-resistance protein n=1 Tax=Sphingobium olei TaxID=420955 RepID=A0ABW3NYY3_9SPHN